MQQTARARNVRRRDRCARHECVSASRVHAAHRHAGSEDVGTVDALIYARRREIRHPHLPVHGAHGDDLGAHTRRFETARAAVSRRAHDGDTPPRQHFRARFERICGDERIRAETHARHLDAEPRAVVEEPLHTFEYGESSRLAGGSYHFERHDLRLGRDPAHPSRRQHSAACGDPGNESAVSVVVIGMLSLSHEVVKLLYPVPRHADVQMRRDARVQHAQRHATPGEPDGGKTLRRISLPAVRHRSDVIQRAHPPLRGDGHDFLHGSQPHRLFAVAAHPHGAYERKARHHVEATFQRRELPRASHPHHGSR